MTLGHLGQFNKIQCDIRSHKVLSNHIQPVPEKMRLEIVIEMQNEILIGIKKLLL